MSQENGQVYLRVANMKHLLKIVHDVDPEHLSIQYDGKDSESYKAISKWHVKETVVSSDDFEAVKGSVDLGTLHSISGGILFYSPQRDAYLGFNWGNRKLFTHPQDIFPGLILLDVDANEDNEFIDPTRTSFTTQMIDLALESKTVTKTQLVVC